MDNTFHDFRRLYPFDQLQGTLTCMSHANAERF